MAMNRTELLYECPDDLGEISHDDGSIHFSGVTRTNFLKPKVFHKRIRGSMCRDLFSKRPPMDLETMFMVPELNSYSILTRSESVNGKIAMRGG
jgi:hypothetical protein